MVIPYQHLSFYHVEHRVTLYKREMGKNEWVQVGYGCYKQAKYEPDEYLKLVGDTDDK
jgi:hypothetical protein